MNVVEKTPKSKEPKPKKEPKSKKKKESEPLIESRAVPIDEDDEEIGDFEGAILKKDVDYCRQQILRIFAKGAALKLKDPKFKLLKKYAGDCGSAVLGVKKIAENFSGKEVASDGWDPNPNGHSKVLLKQIKEWAKTLLDGIVEKIRTAVGGILGDLGISDFLERCTDFIKETIATFIPAGVGDIVKGLASLIPKIVKKVGQWIDAKKIKIVKAGHPREIYDALESYFNRMILADLYKVVKGAGKLAADVASFGGAELVNAILSVAEVVTKFLWRMMEVHTIKKFMADCAAKQKISGFNEDKKGFALWLSPFLKKAPYLAAVMIKAGSMISGDLGFYVAFVESDGKTMKVEDFQATMDRLIQQRKVADDVIKGCTYKFDALEQKEGEEEGSPANKLRQHATAAMKLVYTPIPESGWTEAVKMQLNEKLTVYKKKAEKKARTAKRKISRKTRTFSLRHSLTNLRRSIVGKEKIGKGQKKALLGDDYEHADEADD